MKLPWTSTPPTPTETATYYAQTAKAHILDLPTPYLVGGILVAGSVSTVAGLRVHRRYFQRIRSADWLTPATFSTNKPRWIKGKVTAVGDSDNFRLYHTPAFGWRWPLKFRTVPTATKELRNETIHIRVAGADAPEAAHFGKPAQPYSAESLEWLKSTVLGKTVYCQLLQRDQYTRIVANVTLAPRILPGTFFTGKVLALEMIKAGWATTYVAAGAQYGDAGKEEYLRLEEIAQKAKKGMWAKGTKGESPAEYKRRTAAM